MNTNEFVNKYYKDLFKYPELMWKLFCLTSTEKNQFHEYIKPIQKSKLIRYRSLFYKCPHMKSDEVDLFRQLNSDDEIKRMAIDFGLTDKEIDEVFGLVKKRKKK